jgi:hypothetical protein
MWNRRSFIAVLLLAIYGPVLAADSALDSKLVGRWSYKGARGEAILVIAKDGTFSSTVRLTGQGEEHSEGTWATDKDYIYWVYIKSSSPKVKVGARDRDRLVEIGKDHFEIHTRSNTVHTYFRVK